MLEILDTAPEVDVDAAEYTRLLGYPRGFVVTDRARELVEWARAWYGEHGRPWVYAREVEVAPGADGRVVLDGEMFDSWRLASTLRDAGAERAVVAAVGAGPELEAHARELWQDGKPDEYFFLEVYGSAVVEHLVTVSGARLCAWADGHAMAVLPHYSPGYPDWAIDEQPRLLALINRRTTGPVPLRVLDSGMLQPKKSLLAVFGVTSRVERVRPLTALSPCENCSYRPCHYRRAPYTRAARSSDPELSAIGHVDLGDEREPATGRRVLDSKASYSVNRKALGRWRDERLSIARAGDGTVEAVFRYEGTTCTNMGRALRFQYRVTLGPSSEGYPIRHQHCAPAADDDGHTFMCRYASAGDQLIADIGREQPLLGKPLNDVLTWVRPASAAGCYCEADSRQHKWGLVLETIHFALAGEESGRTSGNEGEGE
jgi:hypothetical protein